MATERHITYGKAGIGQPDVSRRGQSETIYQGT